MDSKDLRSQQQWIRELLFENQHARGNSPYVKMGAATHRYAESIRRIYHNVMRCHTVQRTKLTSTATVGASRRARIRCIAGTSSWKNVSGSWTMPTRGKPLKSTQKTVERRILLGCQLPTRQGDIFGHFFNSAIAQEFDLPVWHEVQGFGIPDRSVSAGDMNRKVCAATLLSLIVCSMCGMWHAMHWLPGLLASWCVCSLTVPFSPAGFCLV